jgi:CheY-like chemotaxis protein
MKESILKGKRILAVDDEPDVLATLEEEILGTSPDCRFDKATEYDEAVQKIRSSSYDVIILDIMGVSGFKLLELAVSRNLLVVMLTAHALSPEALKRSYELKARAYLPKEKLSEVVPFLEDALTHEFSSGWKRLFEKMTDFFDKKFGEGWKTKLGTDWWGWD